MDNKLEAPTFIPDNRVPDIFKDVRTFLQLAQPEMIHKLGEPIRQNVAELAWKLIDEEVNKELKDDLALLANGQFSLEILARVLDHYMDIIYVAAWAVEAFGLPAYAAWNEVQRANMSKFPIVTGPAPLALDDQIPIEINERHIKGEFHTRWILTNKDTGKVVKPEGFTPPDVWSVVYSMMMINKIRTMPDVIATPFMKQYFHEMERRREESK